LRAFGASALIAALLARRFGDRLMKNASTQYPALLYAARFASCYTLQD